MFNGSPGSQLRASGQGRYTQVDEEAVGARGCNRLQQFPPFPGELVPPATPATRTGQGMDTALSKDLHKAVACGQAPLEFLTGLPADPRPGWPEMLRRTSKGVPSLEVWQTPFCLRLCQPSAPSPAGLEAAGGEPSQTLSLPYCPAPWQRGKPG